jgi:hypothetical protein
MGKTPTLPVCADDSGRQAAVPRKVVGVCFENNNSDVTYGSVACWVEYTPRWCGLAGA